MRVTSLLIYFSFLAGAAVLLASEPPASSARRLFVLEYEQPKTATPDRASELKLARKIIAERLRARELDANVGIVNQQVWVRVSNGSYNLINAVRNALKARGLVEFRVVLPEGAVDEYDPIPFKSVHRGRAFEELLWVKRGAELGNQDIKNAYPIATDNDSYEIIVELTESGRSRFATLTRRITTPENQNGPARRVAIMLDGTVLAAPVVRQPIDTDRIAISGQFAKREALEFAMLLSTPLVLPPLREERDF